MDRDDARDREGDARDRQGEARHREGGVQRGTDQGRDEEEPNLGVLLLLPYRAMEQRVFAALAAAGFEDLTQAQGKVFQRIGPDGSRLTDLADAAQVTKQTAGYLVDQLERAGYVSRTPDPADARARRIRITERGAAAVAVGAAVVAEVEEEWAAHVGAAEVADLRRTLLRLREITDPYA